MKLMAPKFEKPYVKSNQNGATDAEAIYGEAELALTVPSLLEVAQSQVCSPNSRHSIGAKYASIIEIR